MTNAEQYDNMIDAVSRVQEHVYVRRVSLRDSGTTGR